MMNYVNVARLFSRLTLNSLQNNIKRDIAIDARLNFKATPCLFAEPLKKKKRLDPAVIKAREERKKKKIEKQIRRLEKNARQMKPIEECEVPLQLLDEKKQRLRPQAELSSADLQYRSLLEKQWAAYKKKQHLSDVQMLDTLLYSQQRALDELKKESEELYNEAIQSDFMMLPFKFEGPLETPPIENYDSPDGDYLDVSKKWE